MLKKFILLFFCVLPNAFFPDAPPANAPASGGATTASSIASQASAAAQVSTPAAAGPTVIPGFPGDCGIATIEQIRNLTSSYCDLFLRKELNSLQSEIPTNSVIKIKTIDPYFSPDPQDPSADPYLYYKVERLSGTFRLVASTKDKNDPDTEFTVSHMRDEQLADWLMLQPVAQDTLYVTAKKGQEVSLKAVDQNSPIDLNSDTSPHWSHWQVIGSSFASCELKSRSTLNGFLSCRDLSDQKEPECFGFQPAILKAGNKLVYPSITVYGWDTHNDNENKSPGFTNVFRRLNSLQNPNFTLDNLSNAGLLKIKNDDAVGTTLTRAVYKGLTTDYKGFHVFAWLKTIAAMDPRVVPHQTQDFQFCKPDDFKLEHAILLARAAPLIHDCVVNIGNTNGDQDGGTITIPKNAGDDLSKTFSPDLGVFSKALLDAATRESSFEKAVSYGDIIRIANIKTCLHLFSGLDKATVCLASEYNREFDSVFIPNKDMDQSQFVFPYAYFIIKGPHAGDDEMNANVGDAVKDGDKIRLEAVFCGKNLSCAKQAASAGGDDTVKPLLAGTNGVGTNNDNFIINFFQADGSKSKPNLCYGQLFKLMHQNTGMYLTFDATPITTFDPAKTPLAVGTTPKSQDGAFWTIDFCQKAVAPVKRVAWTGVPYGASATDVTNKENLTIEIVKKGMGGGIPQNATLNFGAIKLSEEEPLLTGFTKETLDGFSSGQQITLNPLLSQGVGWVSTSFQQENQAGITFLIRAMDSGNAEIILGSDMSLDYVYKLVVGAKDNTCTILYRRTFDASGTPVDTPVLEVDKSVVPAAALRSGLFAPYWVSVNNGIIMAGMGQQIGQNILIAYKEPLDQASVSRIGFGCNKDKIDITEVNIGLPLDIGSPSVTFITSPGPVSLGTEGAPSNLNALFAKAPSQTSLATPRVLSLRVPGRASLSFDLPLEKSIKFNLVKKADPGSHDKKTTNYRISLNTALSSQKDALVAKNWAAAKDFVTKMDGYLKDALNVPSIVATTPVTSVNITDFCSKLEAGLTKDLPSDVFVNKDLSANTVSAVECFIDKFGAAVSPLTEMTYGDMQTLVGKISDPSIKSFSDLIGPNGLGITVAKDLGLGNYGNVASLKAALVSLLSQMFNNNYFNLFKRACFTIEKNAGGSAMKVLTVIDDSCIDGFEKNDDGKTVTFWLNLVDGAFFAGTGDFGKNVFCYTQDFQVGSAKNALDVFNDIEVYCDSTTPGATLANLTLGSELEITNLQPDSNYNLNQTIFNYKGSFEIISPYRYRLSQQDAQVFFTDEISNVTLIPGKVPQRGAIYKFMLILSDDSAPQLQWVTEPDNPTMLNLAKQASILRSTQDALGQAASYVQGTGTIGGMIGVAASTAFAGSSVGVAQAAAQAEAQLKDFKAVDAQVFTDQTNLNPLMDSSIPADAQANFTEFEKDLTVGGNWIGDPTKLGLLIPHFQKCISLITHPYVISNQSDKALLISYLASLYKTHQITYSDPTQKVDNTFYDMIKLFMDAYNNRYLIDQTNQDDLKTQKSWYLNANDLFSRILQSLNKTDDTTSRTYIDPIELPAMSGEYVWLDKVLPTPGRGSVSFNAKGLNDMLVSFTNERKSLRNCSDQIYEVDFGAKNNSCAEIRTASLSKPTLSTTNPAALCEEVDVQTAYWVNINNGSVEIGRGPLGSVLKNNTQLDSLLAMSLDQLGALDAASKLNPTVAVDKASPAATNLVQKPGFKSVSKSIITWPDPFPISDFQYVGISSWDGPVTYSNICVDESKDAIGFDQKINAALLASIQHIVSQAQSMAAQSPSIMSSHLKDVPNFPDVVFSKFTSRVEFIDATDPTGVTVIVPLPAPEAQAVPAAPAPAVDPAASAPAADPSTDPGTTDTASPGTDPGAAATADPSADPGAASAQPDPGAAASADPGADQGVAAAPDPSATADANPSDQAAQGPSGGGQAQAGSPAAQAAPPVSPAPAVAQPVAQVAQAMAVSPVTASPKKLSGIGVLKKAVKTAVKGLVKTAAQVDQVITSDGANSGSNISGAPVSMGAPGATTAQAPSTKPASAASAAADDF